MIPSFADLTSVTCKCANAILWY